jgi:hypothetical protein
MKELHWKGMTPNKFHQILVREVRATGMKSLGFWKHLPFTWSLLPTQLVKATLKA